MIWCACVKVLLFSQHIVDDLMKRHMNITHTTVVLLYILMQQTTKTRRFHTNKNEHSMRKLPSAWEKIGSSHGMCMRYVADNALCVTLRSYQTRWPIVRIFHFISFHRAIFWN